MARQNILMALFATGLILAVGCGGDDSTEPKGDPPVVTGVSPAIVSPGDEVTITGSNFSATAGDNTVTFANPSSGKKPTQASATQLKVLVSESAVSGPVSVTTPFGAGKGPSIEVQHGVGDVILFGGVGANYLLKLPNPTATTKYLVVPHSTNSNESFNADEGYKIQSASSVPVVAAPAAPAAVPARLHVGANQWFESRRWENAQKDLERYGVPRGEFAKKPALGAQVALPTKQFYVLKTTIGDQNSSASYAHITAELRYSGTKCYVYADIDTLAFGQNFSQADFNEFGQKFDSSIEATNVSFFGTYSDIDGNGRVYLLVSPVVNRLQEPSCSPSPKCSCGFIAGFFNPRDLYSTSQLPAGTTNHAEIVYLLAADPAGVWDCEFPVLETKSENLGTIPHEHEHLTSFSHRIFHQGSVTQVTWLEEGMAHMAEDLNLDNSSNIGRGKLYRADPGDVSLENNDATLEQRGGIYLMLRLLVDRYGTGILKDIVQSKCTGRACIQNVTGLGFYDVFAQFLAAQYLSGTGITPDARYNYTSIDLNDFGPLTTASHVAGGPDVNGTVRRTAGDFHIFSGVLGQVSQFQFNETDGAPRLRSVIVRIQ